MNPKADAEKIRFCREADSRYCLVHEGSFGGSSKLFYIVRLVEREMGLKLERKVIMATESTAARHFKTTGRSTRASSAGKSAVCWGFRSRNWPSSFVTAAFLDQKLENRGLGNSTREPMHRL